jgi:hypothetical protein
MARFSHLYICKGKKILTFIQLLKGLKMKQKFKDYTITMQDDSGRTCVVSINGDCIAEQISNGETESNARLNVEDNAVSNAIYRKEISVGAWLTTD